MVFSTSTAPIRVSIRDSRDVPSYFDDERREEDGENVVDSEHDENQAARLQI